MSSAITRVSNPSTGSAYTYALAATGQASVSPQGANFGVISAGIMNSKYWHYYVVCIHILSKCSERDRTSVTTRVVRDSVSGLPIMSPITSTGLPPAFMPRSTPLHECISYTATQKMKNASE